MKRWLPWFAIPILFSLWILSNAPTNSGLLQDSDTHVLLANIRERQNPMSWFYGDWPLYNHFYRPISTLFFEFDNALYGQRAAGYGFTNALIAALCVIGAFWLIRELTDDPPTTAIATALFGFAHISLELPTAAFGILFSALAFVSICGLARGKLSTRFWPVALAIFACIFLMALIPGPLNIRSRIVDWLPGRTASVMTLFALPAIAAFIRYLRLTAQITPQPPTPFDQPATKSTVIISSSPKTKLLPFIAAIGLLLALGSYEQAVTIPGILTGALILSHFQGRKVPWIHLTWIWGSLFGYLALRAAVIPRDVSQYQDQQFRSGPGVYMDLANYIAPGFAGIPQLGTIAELGIASLLSGLIWTAIAVLIGNIAVIVGLAKSRDRWLIIATWIMAFVAFLPMAWLKFFGHYHYFPAPFYCLLLVLLAKQTITWVIEAISPTPVQAPPLRVSGEGVGG
jgi:hypothetical protein